MPASLTRSSWFVSDRTRSRTPTSPSPWRRPTVVGVSGASRCWFDPNDVGADLVVECWISHGPCSGDPSFDPPIGDWVRVGDDVEAPLRARVTRRDGDRVWVQIALPSPSAADAIA